MNFATTLREHIAACFPGIWVESREQDEASQEIHRLASLQGWTCHDWNIDTGLNRDPNHTDPLAVLKSLDALRTPDGTTLLIMRNLHRFIQSPEIIQAIDTQLAEGKSRRTFLIILAPTVELPPELERGFVVIEHELPTREQLAEIARQLATEEGELPQDEELEHLLDAAAGLTRAEAEGAYSLSLIRHGKIHPKAIWQIKESGLRKSGLLTMHRGQETFESIGGLGSIKRFCAQALAPTRAGRAMPRGVLLLGVPGTGKSAFAKALGNQTSRPTLMMDIGRLMGGLVGQTESNVRAALKIVDAMQPCILFIDELEKGLSGLGGNGDSGVSSRLFGSLLTWMNDHESDVFVVATCNDASKLPPELTRAERFDATFFLDFPSPEDRAGIWSLYEEHYQLHKYDTANRPNDENWTGAEIKACCRLASLLNCNLQEASGHVVPIGVTAAEKISALRQWAHGRCLSAERPGIYLATTPTTPTNKATTDATNKSTTRPRRIERPRHPEDN